jgi:hypothetical protein
MRTYYALSGLGNLGFIALKGRNMSAMGVAHRNICDGCNGLALLPSFISHSFLHFFKNQLIDFQVFTIIEMSVLLRSEREHQRRMFFIAPKSFYIPGAC